MMLSVSFECDSAKGKIWIPPNHAVMPMLFRFFSAIRPVYGRVATDDIDGLNRYTVEEVNWGTAAWAGLWQDVSGCVFFNPALVLAIEERSGLLEADGGLGHVVRLPGVGLWCTDPSDWIANSSKNEKNQHWEAIYELTAVLKTIPDSAIFPDLTP
ncbi:hypothetical protein Q0M94_08375 [Deinococcus radiomollis]|uniref:hypothetical protein n=1 Tax=Deinococcus radiomollis TaxID=468916 RepID=UPI0038923F3E